jgi:hypothetical protein
LEDFLMRLGRSTTALLDSADDDIAPFSWAVARPETD